MSDSFQHLRHQAPIAALDGRDAALGKPNELIPQRVPAHFRDTYPRFNVFLPENEVAARPFKVFQYQTHTDLTVVVGSMTMCKKQNSAFDYRCQFTSFMV